MIPAGNEKITDETMEYLERLSELTLSRSEREQVRQELCRILDYADCLGELDTENTEPAVQLFPMYNVFREDIVTSGDPERKLLENAPEQKDGRWRVPRSI